jgi:hypothetical protein
LRQGLAQVLERAFWVGIVKRVLTRLSPLPGIVLVSPGCHRLHPAIPDYFQIPVNCFTVISSQERQLGAIPEIPTLPASVQALFLDALERFASTSNSTNGTPPRFSARCLALQVYDTVEDVEESRQLCKRFEMLLDGATALSQVGGNSIPTLVFYDQPEKGVQLRTRKDLSQFSGCFVDLVSVKQTVTASQPTRAYEGSVHYCFPPKGCCTSAPGSEVNLDSFWTF